MDYIVDKSPVIDEEPGGLSQPSRLLQSSICIFRCKSISIICTQAQEKRERGKERRHTAIERRHISLHNPRSTLITSNEIIRPNRMSRTTNTFQLSQKQRWRMMKYYRTYICWRTEAPSGSAGTSGQTGTGGIL